MHGVENEPQLFSSGQPEMSNFPISISADAASESHKIQRNADEVGKITCGEPPVS